MSEGKVGHSMIMVLFPHHQENPPLLILSKLAPSLLGRVKTFTESSLAMLKICPVC